MAAPARSPGPPSLMMPSQQQQQRPSEQSWASEFTQQAERPPAFAAPAARDVSTAEADAMAAASQQVRCWGILLERPASSVCT